MNTLIVVESSFGNTRAVAGAVAEGVGEDVAVVDVRGAPAEPPKYVDLLVVGGPTHAFGMSRTTTRADAAEKGGSGGPGIRDWIAALSESGQHPPVAVFDTRVGKVRHLPGSAAKGAAKALRSRGFKVVAGPQSFYVNDVAGPLLEGELDRARSWGAQLVEPSAMRA